MGPCFCDFRFPGSVNMGKDGLIRGFPESIPAKYANIFLHKAKKFIHNAQYIVHVVL